MPTLPINWINALRRGGGSLYEKARSVMIDSLTDSGALALMDWAVLFAANTNDGGEALVNLISPGTNNPTLVNDPNFYPLKGFKTNGIDSYINSNFDPDSEDGQYSKDSATFGIYSRIATSNNGVAMGYIDGSSSYRSIIQPWSGAAAGNIAVARINSTSYLGPSNTNTQGSFIVRRSASDAWSFFIGKTKYDSTGASAALNTLDFFIGAYNNSGTPSNFSDNLYSWAFIGGSMSDAQVESIVDAVEIYLTTVSNIEEQLSGILLKASNCWFTRPMAIYNATADKTWIGQVHDSGSGYTQHIVDVDNDDDSVSVVSIGSVISQDDHDEPAMLVRSSDSKVLVTYAEHQYSTNIRYRLSTNANDVSAFGSESTFTADSEVTYPSPYEDANGNIFIFYREVTACACYIKSTDGGVNFGGRVNYFAGIGSRGYVQHEQSQTNKDIIHLFITTQHPVAGTDVSVYAFYFDCSTEKFYKLDGTETTANIPFDAVGDMTEVMAVTDPDGCWIEDIAVDSSGNPRYLITKLLNGKTDDYLTKELYYAEWTGSAVSTPHKIHTETVRHISGEEESYPPKSCFMKGNVDIIVGSKDVDNVLELFKITRIAADNFSSEAITEKSIYDNWRPISVNNTKNNLFYLSKQAYADYDDYNQSLKMITVDIS